MLYCYFINVDDNVAESDLYVHITYVKRQGVDFRKGKKIFLVAGTPETALGTTKPSMQLIPAAFYLPVKWPEREANHAHSILEFGNSWSCVSIPQNVFLARYVINPFTPNDHYIGRTAPLTSKRCILYIYSTNIGTEYFKHGLYSPFFLFKIQFVS